MSRVVSLILLLCLCLSPIAYRKATQGFRLDKVEIELDSRAEWETSPPSFAIPKVFTYLGQGSQCYVFEDLSKKIVLKLFRSDLSKGRKKRFLRKFYAEWFSTPYRIPYPEKIINTFNACKLAYDKASDLTGLLYIHLNRTEHLLPTIQLSDRVGRTYSLPLDSYRFVLQKKATPFDAPFLAAKGDPAKTASLIDRFLDLIEQRIQRGIVNTDRNLCPNFGFVENEAIEIDFGNYTERDSTLSFACERERFASKLRKWLARHSPESVGAVDLHLSLEEKVGQILIGHFHTLEEAKILIQELHIGGIAFYNWANDLSSFEKVADLTSQVRALGGPIPLLLAVDQEGGRVARLREGFTLSPGNWALGETGRPENAEEIAYTMGKEMRAAGLNMTFAPVVDVNCNPLNPVIGTRSFSDKPEVVSAFALAALRGFHRAQILTSLKHFPGHGDTETDSHFALPIVSKSLSSLQNIELRPFRELTPFADTIMTAHLLVPALDPDFPSTFSSKTLSFLRNELQFNGPIVTDSLIMKGILSECASVDEAAVRSFNAGCDILLLSGMLLSDKGPFELSVDDYRRIHSRLVEAVRRGEISREKLDASVQRVLSLKKKL